MAIGVKGGEGEGIGEKSGCLEGEERTIIECRVSIWSGQKEKSDRVLVIAK